MIISERAITRIITIDIFIFMVAAVPFRVFVCEAVYQIVIWLSLGITHVASIRDTRI